MDTLPETRAQRYWRENEQALTAAYEARRQAITDHLTGKTIAELRAMLPDGHTKSGIPKADLVRTIAARDVTKTHEYTLLTTARARAKVDTDTDRNVEAIITAFHDLHQKMTEEAKLSPERHAYSVLSRVEDMTRIAEAATHARRYMAAREEDAEPVAIAARMLIRLSSAFAWQVPTNWSPTRTGIEKISEMQSATTMARTLTPLVPYIVSELGDDIVVGIITALW